MRELLKALKKPASIHIGDNMAVQVNKAQKMEEIIRQDESIRKKYRRAADKFRSGTS